MKKRESNVPSKPWPVSKMGMNIDIPTDDAMENKERKVRIIILAEGPAREIF
jgi:hypothetical protein